jgi:hypothetical protein
VYVGEVGRESERMLCEDVAEDRAGAGCRKQHKRLIRSFPIDRSRTRDDR